VLLLEKNPQNSKPSHIFI